jgi:hypothetical protein
MTLCFEAAFGAAVLEGAVELVSLAVEVLVAASEVVDTTSPLAEDDSLVAIESALLRAPVTADDTPEASTARDEDASAMVDMADEEKLRILELVELAADKTTAETLVIKDDTVTPPGETLEEETITVDITAPVSLVADEALAVTLVAYESAAEGSLVMSNSTSLDTLCIAEDGWLVTLAAVDAEAGELLDDCDANEASGVA